MKDQTTVMPETATQDVTKVLDVLIVGGGISGIGVGYHLQDQMPGKSFAILDANKDIGGTWHIHTYPGVRSDSDLFTFGYRFKPWTGTPVADGDRILDYLNEVIDENGLREKIELNTRVMSLSWSSSEAMWTARIRKGETGEALLYKARFLWMCQGYYDPSAGYTPDWPGFDQYEGDVIHPQTWPEDYDYSGKDILVIGSGATAATIIPNMADKAGHITMLQRSPTYFWTGENRSKLLEFLQALRVPAKLSHSIVRNWVLFWHKMVHAQSRKNPEKVKAKLLDNLKTQLPDGFDIDTHFTPSYRPWQQRLAFVPDGDLFDKVRAGKVSVVTDTIKTFTKDGVLTDGGAQLTPDLVITATGFNLQVMGDIPFDLDGKPVDFADHVTYRGVSFEGLPNMSYMFGYLRTSWTMRVDLVADFVLRILRHMDSTGKTVVTPELGADADMARLPWIADDDFNSGYIKRGQAKMPKQGDRAPWTYNTDYYQECKTLPKVPVDEPALVYSGGS